VCRLYPTSSISRIYSNVLVAPETEAGALYSQGLLSTDVYQHPLSLLDPFGALQLPKSMINFPSSTRVGVVKKDARQALSALDPEQNFVLKEVDKTLPERICVWTCDNCGGQGGMSVEIENCPDCQHPRCENCKAEWHRRPTDEQLRLAVKKKYSMLSIREGAHPSFKRASFTTSRLAAPLQSSVTYVILCLFRDAQYSQILDTAK